MAAEVVVILQNQNARVGVCLAKKMCSGEATDASAHDNQVKTFAGLNRLAGFLPEIAVADAVRNLETSHMASAQPRECGRIVAGSLLWIEIVVKGGQQMRWESGGPNRNCHSIQKIAASYPAIHSKFLVSNIVFGFVVRIFRFRHGPLAHFRLNEIYRRGPNARATSRSGFRAAGLFNLLHRRFSSQETDLAMGSVAKRLIHRSPAAAE